MGILFTIFHAFSILCWIVGVELDYVTILLAHFLCAAVEKKILHST